MPYLCTWPKSLAWTWTLPQAFLARNTDRLLTPIDSSSRRCCWQKISTCASTPIMQTTYEWTRAKTWYSRRRLNPLAACGQACDLTARWSCGLCGTRELGDWLFLILFLLLVAVLCIYINQFRVLHAVHMLWLQSLLYSSADTKCKPTTREYCTSPCRRNFHFRRARWFLGPRTHLQSPVVNARRLVSHAAHTSLLTSRTAQTAGDEKWRQRITIVPVKLSSTMKESTTQQHNLPKVWLPVTRFHRKTLPKHNTIVKSKYIQCYKNKSKPMHDTPAAHWISIPTTPSVHIYTQY